MALSHYVREMSCLKLQAIQFLPSGSGRSVYDRKVWLPDLRLKGNIFTDGCQFI